MYLLFYSNNCKFSAKYIQFLENSGQARNFFKVCVDKNNKGQRPKKIYEYKIEDVPTIIIGNNPKTDHLVGEKAFIWLQKRLHEEGGRISDPMNTRDNKINMRANVDIDNQLLPFDTGGHSITIADNCKSVGDNDTIQYIDDQGLIVDRRNNFLVPTDSITGSVDMEEFNGRGTFQRKDHLKKTQFDNEYSKLMAERDIEIPQTIRRQ